MQLSDLPSKFRIPFANGAGGAYIRDIPLASQIGVQDGAASLTDGFVPLNFTPIGAGGVPPFGADMNGILYQTTGWARWLAAGGSVVFDAAFSTAIGGYPKSALLASATIPGIFYVSTVDNNTTNPDAGGANWLPVAPVAASDAEILAGVDNSKYVGPLGLKNLRATTADVLAATSIEKYITPASLAGLSGGLGSSGYWEFLGGFIFAWSAGTANGNGYTTINWTVPFPGTVYQCWANGGRINTNVQDNGPWATSWNVNGCTVYNAIDDPVPCTVFGIGV
jgi:hypothetical protein